MRVVPPHIWIVAGACWLISLFALIEVNWASEPSSGTIAGDLAAIATVAVICLFPALLGFLLVRGKRWVRWLFVLPVPFSMAVLLLYTFGGLGPDATNDHSLSGPLLMLSISIASAIAVFWHFSHGEKA